MLVGYSSNNSGGDWWLSDQEWKNLEKAGWTVCWISGEDKPYTKPDSEGRYMGALATRAYIEIDSIREALKSFEAATNQSASDNGCKCCGPPHAFSWGYGIHYIPEEVTEKYKLDPWGYASGSELLNYL